MVNKIEEKAKTIFNCFFDEMLGDSTGHRKVAKDCALICCDEVISEIEDLQQNCMMEFPMALEYWQQVKQEIEKL